MLQAQLLGQQARRVGAHKAGAVLDQSADEMAAGAESRRQAQGKVGGPAHWLAVGQPLHAQVVSGRLQQVQAEVRPLAGRHRQAQASRAETVHWPDALVNRAHQGLAADLAEGRTETAHHAIELGTIPAVGVIMGALEQPDYLGVVGAQRRGQRGAGRYPDTPFDIAWPRLARGVGLLGIGKTGPGGGVFIAQVGQHVARLVGENDQGFVRNHAGRSRGKGGLVESVRASGDGVVYQENGQAAAGQEGLEQRVHLGLAGRRHRDETVVEVVRAAEVSVPLDPGIEVSRAGLRRGNEDGEGVEIAAVFPVGRPGEQGGDRVGRSRQEQARLIAGVALGEQHHVQPVGHRAVDQNRAQQGLAIRAQAARSQHAQSQCRDNAEQPAPVTPHPGPLPI